MIVKSNAIVLRSVNYGDSSLIVTLFTRSKGKIAVIAKGARKPKSKFAAMLVPGQVLEVVFYYKTTRSVQTLSDVSYLRNLDRLRVELEKMALAMATLELSSQVLHETDVNTTFFDFLLTFLTWLNDQEKITKIIFPYVQIRIARLIGIGLQDQSEMLPGLQHGYINITSGTLSHQSEESDSVKLTPAQFAFVKESLHSMKSSLFETNMAKNDLNELIECLDRYLRYHIEGLSPRKSDEIFNQILND